MILPPARPDELSPIARCLRIAAARGRALRLAREQAEAQAVEEQPDEDTSTPDMAQATTHGD